MRTARIGLVVWLATLASIGFCEALLAAETGTLTYPAEDNIDMREGTIEFWLEVCFDVQEHLPSTEKYDGLLALVRLAGESGGVTMGYFAGAGYKPSAGLFCSLASKKATLHGFFLGKFLPKPDEWLHLALSWKGKKFWFHLDGEQRVEKTCLEFIHLAFGPMGQHPIFFGDKWHRRAEMVIDELRISTVARRPDELGCHGRLEVDPYTLVLDSFDGRFTPDGKKRTQSAAVFAGVGGLPSKQCEFVGGRFGKGLAFSRATGKEVEMR